MKKMKNRERGFTLSEVIITLVILGIVAAITVPMMSSNAHDKKWNVARQKAKATIGEAFRLMTVNGEINKNLSTQQFVEKIIPKYLKLAKTCTIAKASECGMSTASNFYKTPDGTKVTLPTTWQTSTTPVIVINNGGTTGTYNHSSPDTNNSYFFKTLDGFSVNFFYNPYCMSDKKEKYWRYLQNVYEWTAMDSICLMGVYDMNGKKGPNKVGYDIGFIGSFYNGYNVKSAAVLPHSKENLVTSLPRSGNNFIGAINNYCSNLDKDKSWAVPVIEDVSLMHLNQKLLRNSINYDGWYTSKTIESQNLNMNLSQSLGGSYAGRVAIGGINGYDENNVRYLRCVRANALK